MARKREKVINTLVVGIIALLNLLPLIWLILCSFKLRVDILTWPPKWLFSPIMDNYKLLFTTYDFVSDLKNSIILSLSAAFLATTLGACAAYGLARYRFPFRKQIARVYLILRMLPAIALVVPIYLTASELRLVDSYASIIPVYIGVALPFAVWMLHSFFSDLPVELEEAAKIDGCSRLKTLTSIVLPLSAPGVAATLIFTTTLVWNEFLFALVLTANATRTLPVNVSSFITDRGILWGQLSAASVVIVTPVLIFTLALQKYIVSGMTMGAVKG